MREAFRPFTKIVTISDQDKVGVALKGTGGDSIFCNYVRVEAVSGTTTGGGWFLVSPTSVNSELPVASYPAASGIGSVSGAVGVVASLESGSAVLSLERYDSCKSIYLSHTGGGSVTFAVTYGVVKSANPVADSSLDPGN